MHRSDAYRVGTSGQYRSLATLERRETMDWRRFGVTITVVDDAMRLSRDASGRKVGREASEGRLVSVSREGGMPLWP